MEQGMDLHELQALMAPRPFFVSGERRHTCRWPVLNHVAAVDRLLGYEQRSACRAAQHDPTPVERTIYHFFEHFLKPTP